MSIPAFASIDGTDHAGYLWVFTICGIIYAAAATVSRWVIKSGLHGIDDILLFLGTLAHIVQAILVFYGLKNGLAKYNTLTTEENWRISGKAAFASQLSTILSLCLSKSSTAALLMRVFTADTERRKRWFACRGLMAVVIFWGLGSIVGLAANCDASTVLTGARGHACAQQFVRWKAITAFDIMTELAIGFLPVFLIVPLNMPWAQKINIAFAFSFRILLIIPAALHLRYVDAYLRSSQPQFAVTDVLMAQQVMLTWSCISACVPNLRGFMAAFSTGLGIQTLANTMHPRRGSAYGGAYELRTIGSIPAKSRRRTAHWAEDQPREAISEHGERFETPTFRPDSCAHEVTITHSSPSSVLTGDGESIARVGSREVIIRKDVWIH